MRARKRASAHSVTRKNSKRLAATFAFAVWACLLAAPGCVTAGDTPADAGAFYARGIAHAENGRYDRAITDYDEAIHLEPDFAAAFNERGIAYWNKGAYDRAIADLDEAIRLRPDYARAFNNRGDVYMHGLGKKSDACNDWKKACEIGNCTKLDAAKDRGNC